MVPTKKNHVLAALLLVATTAAIVGRGVQGVTTPTNVVGASKALIFGIAPCSTGSSINVATAPPFANATVQLQCAAAPALSRSKPDNIAERQGRQSRMAIRGPVISADVDDDIIVWATVEADTDGEFVLELGVINNSGGGGGGGGGGLLSSSMLANNCEVVVTTPLAACDASLARVNGTLRAPVRPICTVGPFQGFAAAPFSFA